MVNNCLRALSVNDFLTIEKIYKIKLPKEFKEVYSNVRYHSGQLYDWGDFSEENVNKIKRLIKAVKDDLYENIDDIEWSNDWGEEPQNIDVKRKIIEKKIEDAPNLIPISGHRYIAAMDELEKAPVVSIVDTDIIYYSFDLNGFFSGKKIPKETLIANLPYIPFWTDIM
ncbi:hypothetical protein J5581_11380 [Streptococcus suis]|uniref:hypothetical protein n=1 Tax=Streptococcus suis TaxID=1307 RepID=UPI001432311D|nr:hypothetical protein [Streptococcus suis]MBM0241342.1 hypothetical protein [Streptococcus suis]MBM7282951.1 hypothetical protein [Streptococcus suis]MBO4136451.1 hypothetical protein [Streptococcus suis]MCO8180191.1 hypothetical protein [Streptococcus suis]NJW42018.1 hypothetical protein [Streptococcus suis]